jgi:hypothetical protein
MDKETNELTIENPKDIPIVQEAPVFVLGKQAEEYKSIVDAVTKQPLSIVSNIYHPIQHRTVYEKTLEEKEFKIAKALICNKGRTLIIDVIDKVKKEIEILPGDNIVRHVRVFNSYNRKKALSVQSYGMRLVCMNGMIAPGMVDRFRRVHTFKDIALTDISKYIKIGMEAWQQSARLIEASTKITIDIKETFKELKFHKMFAKKYLKTIQDNLNKKETIYDTWNEVTRTLTHDAAQNISTEHLISLQERANRLFDVVREQLQNS